VFQEPGRGYLRPGSSHHRRVLQGRPTAVNITKGTAIFWPLIPAPSRGQTECEHSTLVRAYSDTVIRGLGLQHLTHYAQEKPSKVVTITWMARRWVTSVSDTSLESTSTVH
jgi:hypothetical protein